MNVQKYILGFLILGSAVAFNPFLNTDVFEFPKLVVLFGSVSVLTVLNIFEIAWHGWPRIPWRKFRAELLFLALFLLANVTAFIFSNNKQASLMGEAYRFQGMLTQFHYVLLFFNVAYVLLSQDWEELRAWISGVLRIALFLICTLALLPYVFPLTFPFYFFTPSFFSHRVFGTFGNPNYLAVFLIGALPFLFGEGTSKKWWYGLLGILVLTTLFLSGSRSAWAVLIFVSFAVGVFNIVKRKRYTVLAITLAAAILLVVAGALKSNLPFTAPQLERLSFDTSQSTSLQTRLHLWKAGVRMSLDRPLIGFGQDNIRRNIETYLPEYLQANEVFFIDRTHSEVVDMLVMLGVFGALGYVGLFITIFAKSLKKLFGGDERDAEHLLPFLAAFVSLFLFHAVNFSTVSSNVLLYLFACIVMVRSTASPVNTVYSVPRVP